MRVIERDLREPERIVGELQPGGYVKLLELGFQGNYISISVLDFPLLLTLRFCKSHLLL